jgi:hypothetical protein
MSGSSLRRTAPSGNAISTGGTGAPGRGSARYRVENSNRRPHRRGTFALATAALTSSTTP